MLGNNDCPPYAPLTHADVVLSLEALGGPTFLESQAVFHVCAMLSASPRSEFTVTLQSVNFNARGRPF